MNDSNKANLWIENFNFEIMNFEIMNFEIKRI